MNYALWKYIKYHETLISQYGYLWVLPLHNRCDIRSVYSGFIGSTVENAPYPFSTPSFGGALGAEQ